MVVVDSWTCRHVLAKGRYQGRQEEDRQWFLSFHAMLLSQLRRSRLWWKFSLRKTNRILNCYTGSVH